MTSTPPQHLQALGEANRVRYAGAAVRREIEALSRVDGLRRVAQMLEDGDDRLDVLRVEQLVRTIYRIGPSAYAKLVEPIQTIRYATRVRDLTERQRTALVLVLRLHAENAR